MRYSIITPCYKQEKLITQTLDSVLAQTSKDWEHLCTDDGGPDATGEVLDAYVRAHCDEVKEYEIEQDGERKRVLEGAVRDGGVIKVIHQKNAGMAGARNAAKRLATGDWHINLDGDDLLPPFMMEALDACIEAEPDIDMIRGGIVKFKDGTAPDFGKRDLSYKIVDASGPMREGLVPGAFQQMVYNKRICGDINIEGQMWSEERLYTARCIVKTQKIAVTNAVIYAYRFHNDQFTASAHACTLAECNCFLDTTRQILALYTDSGRGMTRQVHHGLMAHWMEWQVRRIVERLPKADHAAAWRYWRASLKQIGQFKPSLWFATTAWICRLLPFPFVAVVLCYWPDWLKQHGVHR